MGQESPSHCGYTRPRYRLGAAWEANGLDINTAMDPEGMAATNVINYTASSNLSLQELSDRLPSWLSHHHISKNHPATLSPCSALFFMLLPITPYVIYLSVCLLSSPPKMEALRAETFFVTV